MQVIRRYFIKGNTVYCETGTITEGVENLTCNVHHASTYTLRQELQEQAKKLQQEQLKLETERRIKQDEEITQRVQYLQTEGGRALVARIAKQYDTYLSTWEYYVTANGQLIRRRSDDEATVLFNDIDELIDDFGRYRWAGFNIV